jgi:hypothetical protein
MSAWADFDHYVAEHGIPEEDYPAALALWVSHQANGVLPFFEKVSVRQQTSRSKGTISRGQSQGPTATGSDDLSLRSKRFRPHGRG